MGLSSSKTKEYATTVRPPQGWGTFRLNGVRHFVTKDGDDKLKFEWHHPDSGTDLDHFLNITLVEKNGTETAKDRRSMQIFQKIVEINGLEFEESDPATIAKLFESNISAMDLKIAWGEGDGTFVNDVAEAGSQAGPHAAQEPSVAQTPTTTTPKQRKAF